MKTKRAFLSVGFVCICVALKAAADESTDAVSTVEAFHNALAHGDGQAAMKLLSADAVILESGAAETRSQYERDHLPEDIQFARAVQINRSDVHVQIEGNAAWLTSRSRAEGSFAGKPINSVGVELVVLTKTSEGWQIRAIHWSSRKR